MIKFARKYTSKYPSYTTHRPLRNKDQNKENIPDSGKHINKQEWKKKYILEINYNLGNKTKSTSSVCKTLYIHLHDWAASCKQFPGTNYRYEIPH